MSQLNYSWHPAGLLLSLRVPPTSAQTLEEFAPGICESFRLETVSQRLSGIAHYHREAGLYPPIRASLSGFMGKAKRHLKEAPGGKLRRRALPYDQRRHQRSRRGAALSIERSSRRYRRRCAKFGAHSLRAGMITACSKN